MAMFSEPYCSVVNVGGGGRGEGKWKLECIKSSQNIFLNIARVGHRGTNSFK